MVREAPQGLRAWGIRQIAVAVGALDSSGFGNWHSYRLDPESSLQSRGPTSVVELPNVGCSLPSSRACSLLLASGQRETAVP